MSGRSDDLAGEGRETVREEAAVWLARMRRPDAERFCADHERWLASDPQHRAAYERMLRRFEEAKVLQAGLVPPERRRRSSLHLQLAAAIALGGIASLGLLMTEESFSPSRAPQPGRMPGSPQLVLRSGPVNAQQKQLADGSIVRLSRATILAVSYSKAVRELRLTSGSARFSVANEARPFVVAAGGGRVTAHGTIFDVRITSGDAVEVALIEGRIDVDVPSAPGQPASHQQLARGQRISFLRAGVDDTAATREAGQVAETGPVDFDHAALADVIARANRMGGEQVRLADTSLGFARVSGAFRIDEPAPLARHLAALLDLKVDRDARGELVLSRR